MSDIPLEYFLPLPQANSDGEIVDIRHLPGETAHALHALQISDEQLKAIGEKHLKHMRLLHEQVLERYNRAKQKVQIRVRKARSRQADYPDNLERHGFGGSCSTRIWRDSFPTKRSFAGSTVLPADGSNALSAP